MRPLTTTLALFLSLSPAYARQVPRELPYPAFVSGEASAVVIGRLNDDVVLDAAVLQGGHVYLVCNPDRYNTFREVEGVYTSICRVPLTATGGDGVLATTSTGVALLSWSPTSHTLVATTALTNTDWASGRQLQMVQRSPTSSVLVHGLAATGPKILSAQWSGTQLLSPSVVSSTTTAMAMSGVFWDGDGALDFACDDGSYLRVVSASGAVLCSYPSGYASPQLLRLPATGCASCADSLIWLSSLYGNQVITVSHANGSNQVVFDQVIPSYTSVVARLTLADFDADGKADLVATRSDQALARVLYRQVGSPPFGLFGGSGGEQGLELALPNAGTCGVAPAAAAGDLDGDGDDDMYYAGHPGCLGEACVYFANGKDALAQRVWFRSGSFTLYEEPSEGHAACFVFDTKAMPPAVASAGGTHLRVRVWACGGGSAIGEQLADYAEPVPEVAYIYLDSPTSGPFPKDLFVEASFEQRSSGDAVARSFPPWMGAMNVEEGLVFEALSGGTGGLLPPPLPPPSGPNP